MYRPTGSVVQLMDGRVFKRNQKNQNLWENINTGAMINEQQLNLMITSAAFTADASGGGNTKRETAPVPDPDPVVSLSAQFDDIFTNTGSGLNSPRTITTTAPVTLRLTFQPGTYESCTVGVYKNNTRFVNIRISASPPSPVTLSETFANGDQMNFDFSYSATAVRNFDVVIEKIAPGTVQVVDTFNISNTI